MQRYKSEVSITIQARVRQPIKTDVMPAAETKKMTQTRRISLLVSLLMGSLGSDLISINGLHFGGDLGDERSAWAARRGPKYHFVPSGKGTRELRIVDAFRGIVC